MMFNVYDLQKQLVAAACPSGWEGEKIAPLLAKLAKPFCDEVTTDALGNIICRKKGKGKKIMMAAHMDAIGFLVTFVDDKGFLWFDNIGGFMPAMLVNTRVRFLNGTRGIICCKKMIKSFGKTMPQIAMSDLFIDIGASDKADAEKYVRLGDVAVFEGELGKAAGGNLMGPYADDLIACTVLLMAMEQIKKCDNDLYFVFTSQEEVGCRGAKTASYAIKPDIGLACDVCGVGDTPNNRDVRMAVSLGAGPAIKIKDSSVISSRELNAKMHALARQEKIAVQDEILTGGGTDTCAMQMAAGGAMATCISIPTRNIHSQVEMFNAGDAELAAKLIAAACVKL